MASTLAPATALLDTISLYLHIPFCHAKCHYCDFNSYAGMLGWRRRYTRALIDEIAALGQAARHADGQRRRCRTIFFGGGTPSLLPAHEIEEILAAAHAAFVVAPDAEVTLEANPGTLERGHLGDVRAAGVNRLSMGAQSFDAGLLKWMGRIHSPDEIVAAVHAARAAGFDNLNLDFIFALPDQTLEQWHDTLQRAIALAPEHLSLYSLIVEPETPLFDWVASGRVVPASEDLAADLYQMALDLLAAAGYEQYEISNWARAGRACAHNLTYWHNLPYLGAGAGAHSSYAGRRFSNVRPIADYVAALSAGWQPLPETIGLPGGPTVESMTIGRAEELAETVILALRLNEGLDLDAFAARFGVPLDAVYPGTVDRLRAWGLVEIAAPDPTRQGHLCLTKRGRLLGNEVFEQFLPPET
jgi:oxygen-independent coproporphyrinogen-3 oxidase